ncbi:MAG: tRNA (guanosine(46)-N7)-methyltransferase TrmB, partial [Gammaproteobacteria bacterium]
VIRSFVRREGRFTNAQRAALEKHWPKYGIDVDQNQILDLEQVFQNVQPVVIDIGFGNGESLLTLARQHQQLNFVGVEVYRPGMGNLLKKLFEANLNNVRVINADVVELLQNNIASNSFSATLIWFADPWPKKRHHKRRLIQVPFLQLLADKLDVEGELNIATDWQPYAEHIQEKIRESNLFVETSKSSFVKKRPRTKFERRGEKLGHQVFEQIYIKKSS